MTVKKIIGLILIVLAVMSLPWTAYSGATLSIFALIFGTGTLLFAPHDTESRTSSALFDAGASKWAKASLAGKMIIAASLVIFGVEMMIFPTADEIIQSTLLIMMLGLLLSVFGAVMDARR